MINEEIETLKKTVFVNTGTINIIQNRINILTKALIIIKRDFDLLLLEFKKLKGGMKYGNIKGGF